MSSKRPDISIIIPTKNGGDRLRRVLDSIQSQNSAARIEVLAIDSGSTDTTIRMLEAYSCRIHTIEPKEFSHSRTRNLGARLSISEKYVVFLNQDAIPVGDNWLEGLVKSIEYEPGIKAVCASELIEIDSAFNVTGVASYVFRNSLIKGLYIIEPNLVTRYSNISKHQLRELFPFTTVCAIFNKQHFLENPFNEAVAWGEDLEWAVRNSNNGFKAACSSLAHVFHYHEYSDKELEQIFAHTKTLYKDLFGIEDMTIADLGREKPRLLRSAKKLINNLRSAT